MNVSDSERIAGFLEKPHLNPMPTGRQALLGKERRLFVPTKDINEADLVIFNTCGVRQMAEDRVYGQIHNIRKQEERSKNKGKRRIIILTGCLADRKDVQRRLKDKVDLFIPIDKFFKIENLKLIENCKLKIENLTQKKQSCDYLNIAPNYTNNDSAYVPIMTGCNNFCAYCVVPYARGREISRPVGDILKEIKNLAKKDCKEIILLGQNVNSYRFIDKNSSLPAGRQAPLKPKKIDFPKLLDSLAQSFPKINFKFLTSHPKDFSEELMKVIAKNKNISREIHLPIQAGSDKILKAMNRPYTQKHYLDLIKKAQKIIPDASFTTDVIVGFPGETQKDFQESLKVFKKVNFNEAYINKYSPRPGTAAYKLGDPITLDEKKRREKVLRKLVKTR